jgi:dephospho-CoA kinase
MAASLVIGLTGGIASGKSTVARLFQTLGAPVVDADRVARDVVAPGTPGLAAVRERFGESVIDSEGALDRARLRERVFADASARADLEAILHPRIRQRMDAILDALDAPYAIAMIPLLLEADQHTRVDRVLVVDAPAELQIARARARDGSPLATLEAILAAQTDRASRLDSADDVIRNDAGPEALEPQVRKLHRDYLALAARLRARSHR